MSYHMDMDKDNPPPHPFVKTLDNLAAAAFYNIAIKREASKSPDSPQWFDSVPKTVRYPISTIRVPKVSTLSEAKELSDKIKARGNDYFKQGEYWEALWKYEHALFICRMPAFPEMKDFAAALHSNIAAVCLKLGEAQRLDLLDSTKFPPSIILWFVYTQQHASEAINYNPPPSILCKAYYRRGESFKVILSMPELQNSIEAMCFSLPNGSGKASSDTFIQVICDFLKCVELQQVPDPKIFCDIIMLAVDHGHLRLLPPMLEYHVRHKVPTNILLEMLKRKDVRTEHLRYLVLKQEIQSNLEPFFDGTKIYAIPLIWRKLGDYDVFKKLYSCGMKILQEEYMLAKEMYQKNMMDKKLFEFILSKQRDSPEEHFFKLKQEGNILFSKGSYDAALGVYYKALNYCRQHSMTEEMAVIRSNCAQACLKLHLYNDAYSHADQCLRINPSSHKGYFRRAEALKAMLDSPQKTTPIRGTYKDVVKDYLESHALQTNVETFSYACKLCIDKDLNHDMIPRLHPQDVRSGFSDKVLLMILTLDNITDKHLRFFLFEWPQKIPKPFTTGQVKIIEVAKRARDPKIYQRFFDLGLKVTDDQLTSIVHMITNECTDVLELILNKIKEKGVPATMQAFLNMSCAQAMVDHKNDLVIVLMEHGAKPVRSELRACDGLRDHPYVVAYLTKGEEKVELNIDEKDYAQAIVTLNRDARSYFKAGKYPQAIQLYKKALELCEEHSLKKEELTTRSNLVLAYMKYENYYDAYMEASTLIKTDPSYAKGHFRRGEALKRCLDAKKGIANKEMLSGYGKVVDDICRGNLIELNPKAFTDAIIVAVDFNEQAKLFHLDKVDTSFFSDVLNELVSRSECEPKHLHYLVCTMWSLREFSAARVSLKRVLSDIGVKELTTIQRLLELGARVKKEDVSTAIDVLKDNDPGQVQTFKYIASKCPQEHLNTLCFRSFEAKKIPFVFSFIECGAVTPGNGIDLLEHALKAEDYITGMDLVRSMPSDIVKGIDLGDIIETNLVRSPKLVKLLVECGVNPNGLRKKSPIVIVMSMEYLHIERRCEVVCVLLIQGADCNHLCRLRKGATTPLHVATEYSLLADGNTSLITAVLQSHTFNPRKLLNDKQETPLHLAVKPHRKREPSSIVLKALIQPGIIDPAKKDKCGKRAVDLLSKKDCRVKILENGAKHFKPSAAQPNKKKEKKKKSTSVKSCTVKNDEPEEQAETPDEVPNEIKVIPARPSAPKNPQFDYDALSPPEKFTWLHGRLLAQSNEYFITVLEESTTEETPASKQVSPRKSTPQEKVKKEQLKSPAQVKSLPREPSPQPTHESDNINSVFAELGFDLDNLPWEVEGTERVVKFFKDGKKNSQTDRVCAARAIFSLAEGHRNKHLATPVSSEPGLSLYEARMTKAARLLWEKAITFSSKLTGLSATPIYTQVIRIWDVVLDHDALERKIKVCTEQIETSYKRGHLASIRWTLQPQDSESPVGGVRGREMIEVPMRFLLPGSKLQNTDYEFIPAESTKEDEYNITTFVSFDTISFKSMLLGTSDRRDYPFKEWQREHEIIKLCSKEAILLLGRSGTGKTTCCLYRLWNEFKAFWNPQSPTHNFKLPRRVLLSPVVIKEAELEEEGSMSDTGSSEDGSQHQTSEKSHENRTTKSRPKRQKYQSTGSCEEPISSMQSSMESTSEQAVASSEQVGGIIDATRSQDLVEEDLHQVFVTKNYVLCDQIKKRFYNMVAAHDFLDEHMDFESNSLPNSFSDVHNLAFPIFLTARQFYILLDNSLGEGETFFRRDPEGNLNVKISSMDYDHEDAEILLDLEDSDSEGEEDANVTLGAQGVEQHAAKQHADRWTEVTALYFKEMVWPTISHQCNLSGHDFDPLLVWIEIQSFIKGSERALHKGAPLNCAEYLELGNKMAPNFSSNRETIFKLFKKYQLYLQKIRHREFLFDECDLMHHLYKRLQNVQDVSWSFHSIFVDEVQDFTQAELAVLIHCCRDPNSMFFTGDTAQSIMRGIAFRFQDLRTLYHRINQHTSLVRVPQKPYSLTINFRSHSGILKLAGSVIDLISEFFKDSIDHLPDDEGMFPGPTPVLVESCEVDELALLLSANRRKASAIEFGAHQAIIVQSKESKERLPDILKGAIVLTIFEAKGLEFDDVLLYNFFTDSLVDEKGWRVISSYLEMARHDAKIVNTSKLPGSVNDPRSRPFDPNLHKSLNAELKYLYTAITRTKCNLWIYDSNQKMRLPMFDYWYKRQLVKVVSTGSPSDIEGMYNLVFASNSTTEQWKAQGDNFRKKHLWEQARLCYERAGAENKYLVKEAQAYHLIQTARQQKPSLYFEAAVLLLECDHLHHKPQYISAAALCLRHTKPPRLHQAGKLYEKLSEYSKACQVYLRAKDFDSFIKLKETIGEYSSVVRTLLGKPFMRKRDALMKAREYEERGVELEPELSASKLSYSCAKFYSERKDKETLVDVLQYMPEMERRVRFLKEVKLFDRAFSDYEQHEQYSDAYRLASAQGWYSKGLALARSQGAMEEEAQFILLKAKSKYKHMLAKSTKSSERFTKDQVVKEIGQDVIDDLSYLMGKGKKQQNITSTYAALLLGMITTDKSLCRLAWRVFKHLKHKIGELEAFNQLQELADESNSSVLEICHLAKDVGKIFQNAKDINNVVKQGLKFYDLQKFGQVYIIPRDQDVWVPEMVAKCQLETEKVDIDGMHRLDTKKVRECISNYCTQFVYRWVERFQLDAEFPANCDSFSLHKQLFTKRHLDREYSVEEVSSEALKKYIQSCMEYLELRLVLDKNIEGLISLLLALFSPQVTRYLPQQFNEHHVGQMRKYTRAHSAFNTWIKESVLTPAKALPDRVLIDQWLTSWRACCLVCPDMKPLVTGLRELEDNVSQKLEEKTKGQGKKEVKLEPPTGFVYKTKDDAYYHVFSMWLLSCDKIRLNHDVLWASRLAIFHFVSEIASSQSVSISVVNMVDILSIHCTALLSILTLVQARQNRSTSFTVPLLYKYSIQLFDNMLAFKDSKWKLLQACSEEVGTKADKQLEKYIEDPRTLLIRSLDILLGTYKRALWFCVLKFALKKRPHDDATRHCLILTLTIFGNLIMLSHPQTMKTYHQTLLHILERIQDKQENVPDYIDQVVRAVKSPTFASPREVFHLVDKLLQLKRGKQPLAKLVPKQAGRHPKVEFIPMHFQPQRMNLPPRLQQHMQFPTPAQPQAPNLPPQTPAQETTLPTPAPQVPASAKPVLPQTQASTPPASVSSPLPVVQPVSEPSAPTSTLPAPIGSGRTVHATQAAMMQPMQYPMQPGMLPLYYPPVLGGNWQLQNSLAGQMAYSAAYPMEGAMGGPTGLLHHQMPTALGKGFLAPTPADIPLTTSEEDPISAHVLASYSIDELRELASNQGPYSSEEFDFSFDFDASQNDGFTQDQEYKEAEEDGGFEEALSGGHSQEPSIPPVDPELLDPSIVTQGYCSACGVSFVPEAEEEMTSSSNDLQYAHVTSEAHRLNTVLCKRFLSIVDSDETDTSYPLLSQKLEDLVIRCEQLKEATDTEKLDKLIDSIKESGEKHDKRVTAIQDKRAWREGIQEAAEMVESMDRLLYNGNKLYDEVVRETNKDPYLPQVAVEELDQGELEMLGGQYGDEGSKVNLIAEAKQKVRTATEKQASRQRKRDRKERQSRSGGGNKRK